MGLSVFVRVASPLNETGPYNEAFRHLGQPVTLVQTQHSPPPSTQPFSATASPSDAEKMLARVTARAAARAARKRERHGQRVDRAVVGGAPHA